MLIMVLDAKCVTCSKNATVNDDMKEVSCTHCGFHSSYDEYIELMKEKALNMSTDFQINLDKNPL